MNRVECEKKLKELMREVWETYQQYNPGGDYLAISFVDGKYMNANNTYWEDDAEKPIFLFTKIDEDEDEN